MLKPNTLQAPLVALVDCFKQGERVALTEDLEQYSLSEGDEGTVKQVVLAGLLYAVELWSYGFSRCLMLTASQLRPTPPEPDWVDDRDPLHF